MESEDAHVRIDHPKFGKPAIFVSALVFGIGFFLCLIIGSTGPDVFTEHQASEKSLTIRPGGSAVWRGKLDSMQPAHRLLWLTVAFERPGWDEGEPTAFDLSYSQEMTLEVIAYNDDEEQFVLNQHVNHTTEITCKSGRQFCKESLLFYEPYIKFPAYHIEAIFYHPFKVHNDISTDIHLDAELQLYYIDANYTAFELGWSYFFLAVTIVVMFLPVYGFFWCLYKVPRAKWSTQQKWLIGLLIGLFFFNGPFLDAEIKNTSSGLGDFYIFCLATFLGLTMLFWLVILDEIRYDNQHGPVHEVGERRRHPRWLVIKFFLCLALWVILIAAYVTMRNRETLDPAYNGVSEINSTNMPYLIATSIFMVIYMVWIGYLAISCITHLKDMLPAYLFLFCITLFTIFMTIIGVFVAAYYPIRSSGVEFLAFFGLYNLYIWMLAIAYTPLSAEAQYGRENHIEGIEFSDVNNNNYNI